MLIPRLKSALAYGGDYNPEQWPEPVWLEDVRLMREAGVNLVTVGVFSWGQLQPSEHRFNFDWLDRVLDLLAKNGIYADLATATASPPPWLSSRYPDALAIDASGLPYHPGSRQHYSPFSPSYRRFARALVKRIAQRYRRHPALAAWHINNEYGNHVAECHSAAAQTAFRAWLQRRYGSLGALNCAWGTAFWSQHYSAWREIQTPRRTPTFANPSQQLDYRRFMSDAVMDLFKMERDVLRAATPDIPVTTNYMGFHKPMNYRLWSDEMDFVSWDSYPDPLPERGGALAAAAGHDLVRSMKKSRPFLLMEQSISNVTWNRINGPKPPGLMRLWSWQALARGSDGVLFFQWRASIAGAEKFLGGMVSHVPHEKSRSFAEVKKLGAELKKLAPISGSLIRAKVAIAFDWEAWWAIEFDSKPAPIAYATWAQEIHAYFFARNIAVDFLHPEESLSDYRVILAPALYLLSQKAADNLTSFVNRGGQLLVTYFSGIVDENEHIVRGGYPSRLRKLLGIWTEEWLPLGGDEKRTIRFRQSMRKAECRDWCELVHAERAEVLASFIDGDAVGAPAITRNRVGRGAAYYLSTKPEPRALRDLLQTLCKAAGVAPILEVPKGVELTVREGEGAHYLFLLNHNARSVVVSLHDFTGHELVSGNFLEGKLRLAPLGATAVRLSQPLPESAFLTSLLA